MTLHELFGPDPMLYEDNDLDEVNVLDAAGKSIAHFPFHDLQSRDAARAMAEAVVAAIKCTRPPEYDPTSSSARVGNAFTGDDE